MSVNCEHGTPNKRLWVPHTLNPSNCKAEADGSLCAQGQVSTKPVPGQPRLGSETLPQRETKESIQFSLLGFTVGECSGTQWDLGLQHVKIIFQCVLCVFSCISLWKCEPGTLLRKQKITWCKLGTKKYHLILSLNWACYLSHR